MAVFLFHMAWVHGTRTPTFVKDAAPNVLTFLSAEHAVYVSVEVIGLAASDGRVYSGFESPVQSYAIVANARHSRDVRSAASMRRPPGTT